MSGLNPQQSTNPNFNVPSQNAHIAPPPYNQGPPPQPPQYLPPQYPTTNYVAPAYGTYPGPYGTTYYNSYGLYVRRMPVSVLGMSVGAYWAYVLIMFAISTIITGIILACIPGYTCTYYPTYHCYNTFDGGNIAGVVCICIGVVMLIAGIVIAVKSKKAYDNYCRQNATQHQQQGSAQATSPNSSTAGPNGQLPVYNYSSNHQISPGQRQY